jgi:hypothetical protein
LVLLISHSTFYYLVYEIIKGKRFKNSRLCDTFLAFVSLVTTHTHMQAQRARRREEKKPAK